MQWTRELTTQLKLEITPRAAEVLDLLAEHPGRRYSTEDIVETLELESHNVLNGLLGEVTKATNRAEIPQEHDHSWFILWEKDPYFHYWLDQERSDWWCESPSRRYWAFMANPNIYDIEKAIVKRKTDLWTIGGSSIGPGDRILIWKALGSSKQRGVVALGRVLSNPFDTDDTDNPYWINSDSGTEVKTRVQVRYELLLSGPMWVGGQHDDTLLSLSPAKSRGGTVFKVTSEQWNSVLMASGGWGSSNDKSRGWSLAEIRHTVSAYIEMLKNELAGNSYVKTTYRKQLISKLDGRNEGAIEFKHQNISAVLAELDYPYIQGYKPRYNYQSALKDEVIRNLQTKSKLSDLVRDNATKVSNDIEVPASLDSVFTEAPSARESSHSPKEITRKGIVIDYGKREAQNRSLGEKGELFVLQIEKKRLMEANHSELAEKVKWVAKEKGDGYGYDIQSYDEDCSPIFIEVKTTNSGQYSSFFISDNEVRKSKELDKAFRIYRVYNFGTNPRVYILKGSVSENCNLKASTYRAFPK
jgi:hypothetical protein